MTKILMYTTRFCPYCMMARQFLQQKKIEFQEIAVDGNPELRRKMAELANGRHTVPQIFINDIPIGGYDDMSQLERLGELDALLYA